MNARAIGSLLARSRRATACLPKFSALAGRFGSRVCKPAPQICPYHFRKHLVRQDMG